MAKGTNIIVSAQPKGVYVEGTMSGTPKPGTMMEQTSNAADGNERFTFQVYQPGTDGDRRLPLILLPDSAVGQLETTAYVTGANCFMYVPAVGEEMNILFGNAAGTGDDVAVGGLLIADTGTGKFIPTTGTPESEPFQAKEALVDPTADQLLWAWYTGY